MVTFPDNFVATKYPGYFWHIPTQALYSIKVDGVLTPLKITGPNHWNNWYEPGYRISVKGVRKVLWWSELQKLSKADSIIPVRIRK
jgi:hypothetical protein